MSKICWHENRQKAPRKTRQVEPSNTHRKSFETHLERLAAQALLSLCLLSTFRKQITDDPQILPVEFR